ncbi:Hypothetical predicted protein, partial [Cloeon dipterum]
MLKIIFLLLAVSYYVQCEHVVKTNDLISRDVTKNFEYYATKWLYSSDVEYFWAKIKANGSNEIELKDSNALNREIPLQKTVTLSFEFPFYGQPIRTLAVTANGFINMHPKQQTERPWRFIAPLMACCQGFDLKNNEIDSSVRWGDTGRTFNVQWENMVSSSFHRKDIFSFQLTLKYDGTILFFYKNISSDMATINILRGGDIRIGISNYHFDLHTRKFEKWHDVIDFTDFDKHRFESSLAIVIWPRQSRSYCFQKKSCTDCTLFSQCVWCSAIKECFMPIDSIWLEKSKFCHANTWSKPNQCSVEISTVSALNLLTDNSTEASVEPNDLSKMENSKLEGRKFALARFIKNGQLFRVTRRKNLVSSQQMNCSNISTFLRYFPLRLHSQRTLAAREQLKTSIVMLRTSKMIVFLAIAHRALFSNAAKGLTVHTTRRIIGSSNVINSYHEFYNSTFVTDKELSATTWKKIPVKQHNYIDTDFFLDCKHPNSLYKLVTLPFDFPFYGHLVRNVAVMMDGYIFLNKISTGSSSVKQYVAPLMAGRFSLNANSSVRWLLE